MNPYEYINRIFEAMGAKNGSDFSSFLPDTPLTRKQRLIEECQKQDVSRYIDDPSEHSTDVYAIFRAIATEAELERRLNAKKAITLSKRANSIAVFALIVSVIALVVSAIPLIKSCL